MDVRERLATCDEDYVSLAVVLTDVLMARWPAFKAAWPSLGDVPCEVVPVLIRQLPGYGYVLTRDDGSPV